MSADWDNLQTVLPGHSLLPARGSQSNFCQGTHYCSSAMLSINLIELLAYMQVLYGLSADALDHVANGGQAAYVFNNTGCVTGGQQATLSSRCTLIPCHDI